MFLVAVVAIIIIFTLSNKKGVVKEVDYNPVLKAEDFSTKITNPYFTLPERGTIYYKGKTQDGVERIEIIITGETKVVNGINTLVYHDKVTLDGELVEDTRDFLAEDKEGNVWYFGEEVDNYEDGVLVDHDGSWLAGTDGAKPGILMKANPIVGETYRQEYYKGKAEDMADVVSITEKLTIGGINYTNCLKTYDYTPLDPEAKEYKFYCKEVGGLVLEEDIVSGDRVEVTGMK